MGADAAASAVGAAIVAALTAALCVPAAARAQGTEVSVRAGIERTTGDYGGPVDVDDLYVPITMLIERRRVALRVTVPYLELELTDATSVDGLPTRTETGLGDAILGVTVFDVLASDDGSLVMDLTGKVELPTADEDRGLGTGEADYSVQADLYKFVGRGVLVGTLGYSVRGDPPGFALDDVWRMSAGGLYRFSRAASGGLFVDVRQSSVPGADSVRELTALVSRQLDERWRVQGYLVRGLGDTSLDWGAGFSVRHDF